MLVVGCRVSAVRAQGRGIRVEPRELIIHGAQAFGQHGAIHAPRLRRATDVRTCVRPEAAVAISKKHPDDRQESGR